MRRFEFAEGSSHKFWEIALEGIGFTVRWGRQGAEGQTQQKSFPTAQKAQAEHDKLIVEKTKKGYAEVAARAPAPAPTPTGLRDAAPAQLPPVLARPPWKDTAGSVPVVPGVKPPALAAVLEWREGEREAWLGTDFPDPCGYQRFTPEEWAAFHVQVDSDIQNGLMWPGSLDASYLALAPEEPLRAHIADFRFPAGGRAQPWVMRVIARLGLDMLPALRLATAKQEDLDLLTPYAAVELVPTMLAALRNERHAATARDWFLRHPAHAAAGLLAPALGKAGKDQDPARALLRLLAAEGHGATVLDVAARATPSPQVREAMAQLVTEDPTRLFPAKLPKLPEALDIAALPRPLFADRSAPLPLPAVEALVTLLSFSPLEKPSPALEQVKAACDRPSLARFAWGLFDFWLNAGASPKDVWAFQALGLLGDDETARQLAPLIRQWPGESAHARAVTGLDVLAAIGTDVTLVYLDGIAEKSQFKALQQKAQEKMEQLAQTRGLSREELADRLVPDLGLDAHGSLTLDFGPRSFTVGFDETLKPFVRDAQGAPLKDLPKPAKTDDPDKARAAAERWKALKQDAKEASTLQLLRLERAMCSRRRWSADAFRRFLVEHPLLVHGVRRLIWGVYSPKGKLKTTFRVAEDRSYADLEEDTFALPEGALVGLPHALELEAATTKTWSRVLADYQLQQPFIQLGRSTHASTREERKSYGLQRWKDLQVPTGKVLGLEKSGWRRGPPQDNGWIHWMEKPLGAQHVARLRLSPGMPVSDLLHEPEQTLGFMGLGAPGQHPDDEGTFFGELDPVLFSELVRDLESVSPG